MQDHYAVLALTHRRADPSLSSAEVRKAYHRSLLAHHPDKSASYSGNNTPVAQPVSPNGFTVDQITTAFDVLRDPAAKAEYDRILVLGGPQRDTQRYFSGLDTVDLDDLTFDESTSTWQRSCRCGHEEGFLVSEADLEAAASAGELVIGCRGCSLWLKVLFQVAPEEDLAEHADQRH